MNETTQITHGSSGVGFWQLVPLLNILLAIVASVRCVRSGRRGLVLVLWLMVVWLLPVIGPFIALFALRRAATVAE